MKIQELLGRVRAGTATESDADELERHLLNDSLVPEVRNRLAYNHHIQKHRNAGIHAHVDLNDFGLVNKIHNEMVGDQVIKAAGQTLAEVGKKHGARVFRTGGDEFKLWFLQPHDAENFGREIGKALANHYATPGNHTLSASIGLGHTEEMAQKAMLDAKRHIKTVNPDGTHERRYAPGTAPTVVCSSLNFPTPHFWESAEDSISRHKNENPAT